MHQLRSASLLVQHANLRLSRARFRGPSRDASGIRIRALIRAYKWMPGVGGYPLGPRPSAVRVLARPPTPPALTSGLTTCYENCTIDDFGGGVR